MPQVNTSRHRVDRSSLLDRTDLSALISADRGPANRSGLWLCPFHDDHDPSLGVSRDRRHYRCWACGAKGDAVSWLIDHRKLAFLDAVRLLDPSRARKPDGLPAVTALVPRARGEIPHARREDRTREAGRSKRPAMLGEDDAHLFLEAAERDLWGPWGTRALAYLRTRGLGDETIRAARLGLTARLPLSGRPEGITLPWFDGPRLVLLKVRQPGGARPKYREVFRSREQPPRIYPGPHGIRLGRPLAIVEGEFDALLLGQALGEAATVVTLGGASASPDLGVLNLLLLAPAWYAAHDADEAGDRAAAHWDRYARARRVRPPRPFKDWTEAGTDAPDSTGTALDLHRWWSRVLAGEETPAPFLGEDLIHWRWGPAAGHAGRTPEGEAATIGPDVPRSSGRSELAGRLATGAMDPDALAEREAIQAESESTEPSVFDLF